MSRFFIGVVLISLLQAGTSYEDSVHAWQKARDAKLRLPDSWLTLVGLHWLKAGENTVELAPGRPVVLRLQGDKVLLVSQGHAPKVLSYDEEKPDVMHDGAFTFYVIKRGDRFALRVKDANSPARIHFQGLEYFPVNPALHFEARFVADAKKIPILNILGETEMDESPGVVEFTYQAHTYRLRPMFEGEGENKTLFFVFKDPTSKTQTYQAGRMLNTPLPKAGKVDLDFNRSYNPPCTFSPFATCPLPPKENILPFPVTAGELRYGKGHVEYAQR